MHNIDKKYMVLKGNIEDILNFLNQYMDKYIYVEELIDHLILSGKSSNIN